MGTFFNADIPEIAQQSKGEINGLNLFACTGIITEIVTRFSYSMLSNVKKGWKVTNAKYCTFSTSLPKLVTLKKVITYLEEVGFITL